MIILNTKYNALLTIYAKYSPKVFWEVRKFESGKLWNLKIENTFKLIILLSKYALNDSKDIYYVTKYLYFK